MAWSGNSFDPIMAEIWTKEVERTAEPMTLLKKFCIIKEDLLKNPGDKIWIPKFGQLTGDGVAEGTELEGNEADYAATAQDVTPVEITNGVKVLKKDLEKTPVALRKECAQALGDWAARKEDSDIWAVAVAGTQVKYGGDATTRASIDSTDVFTAVKASQIAALMKSNNVPQYIVDGISCYIGLLHPRVAYDLKQDTTWINAQRDSALRGNKNNLFTGAIGMLDGVVYYETSQASTATGWGCPSLAAYQSVFFGQRALCIAVGQRWKWVEKEFDYGRKVGLGAYMRSKPAILNDTHIYRLECAVTDIT